MSEPPESAYEYTDRSYNTDFISLLLTVRSVVSEGESGAHSRMGHIVLRFVRIRVVVRPQCKSAEYEYYFHHRPSFAVESSSIYVTTFHKIQKMRLPRVIETFFQIIHFRDSSSKLGCTFFQNSAIKKLPPSTELAANLSYQVGVIFQKEMCKYINPRPETVFCHLCRCRGGGGGWCDPPWCFQTKRRRASQKRPADCARRVLAIGGIIFGPRSIFDPVVAGHRSSFRKFRDFLVSRVHISNTIDCNGMKPSPLCSPFNSA